MTIKLKVGQKVKCRNELEGEVVYYKKFHSGDTQPFGVKLNGMVEPCWYTEDGHYYSTKEEHRHDIVEILTKDEDMTIKLKVGQKVKFRNDTIGVVISEDLSGSDSQPFFVKHLDVPEDEPYLHGNKGTWHTKDGHWHAYKRPNKLDIIEILTEEEDTVEIKARYFTYDNFMYIQNVKESTITIINAWKEEVISVMDYGSPIKAKEQMYTYATLFHENMNTL